MTNKETLLQKIKKNQEIIGIIGLGYVGLPLAVNFAEAGVKVIGFEKSQEKADLVNNGENYIGDIRDAEKDANVEMIADVSWEQMKNTLLEKVREYSLN